MIASVEKLVLFAALGLALVAAFLWRTPHGVGSVAAGGLVAFLNLVILRRTVNGIFGGSRGKRAVMSLALFLKMGLLLATIWAAVHVLGLDPVGVGFGASSLVIGIVGGTLFVPQQQRTDRVEPGR